MNNPNNAMIQTVPAVGQLRRVPGFNPLKYLRQDVSEKTGKRVLKLELPYKKLWFRLACPNGRLLLRPLQVTDQMALYEALVYSDKADASPLARVTSTRERSSVPNGRYVEAAQDAALNEALENAGFGIQLCDLVENAGRADYGSEVVFDAASVKESRKPAAASQNETQPSAQKAGEPVNEMKADPQEKTMAPVQADMESTAQAEAKPFAEKHSPAPALAKTETPVVKQDAPVAKSQAQQVIPDFTTAEVPAVTGADAGGTQGNEATDSASLPDTLKAEPILEETTGKAESHSVEKENIKTEGGESAIPEDQKKVSGAVIQFPALTRPESEPVLPKTKAAVSTESGYTAEMTVPEILERMTLEDAKAVVVTNGLCKNWTLAEVLEKRPSSLRYFLCAPTADNILKAGAQMMLEHAKQKAG